MYAGQPLRGRFAQQTFVGDRIQFLSGEVIRGRVTHLDDDAGRELFDVDQRRVLLLFTEDASAAPISSNANDKIQRMGNGAGIARDAKYIKVGPTCDFEAAAISAISPSAEIAFRHSLCPSPEANAVVFQAWHAKNFFVLQREKPSPRRQRECWIAGAEQNHRRNLETRGHVHQPGIVGEKRRALGDHRPAEFRQRQFVRPC